MSISFNEISINLRTPGVFAEYDASEAAQGPALLPYRCLAMVQKTAAGDAAGDSFHRVTNVAQAIERCGRGSIGHRMALAWFASNQATELWLGVLADDGAGTAASGTITVTATSSKSGTIALYLGGVRITVGVTEGDDANTIATAIAAAITAAADLPVTASASTNVVTVTFRHKGEVGNAYDMRDSFADGEELPEGVSLAFVQLASGAGNPALTNLIAAMGDTWYHVIAHPFTDSTNLTAIENELASRFGPMRGVDGVAVTSIVGSVATLAAAGNARNSPHSVLFAQPGINPVTPAMEHAAECAAVIAKYGAEDPARPFQTLPLVNATPPHEDDLFTPGERNSLLFDGVATTLVSGGKQRLEAAITTYQTNASGGTDTAYLYVNTLLTLMYLRFSFRVWMLAKYPRHKLANDGTRLPPGQKIVTPKLARGEAVSWFGAMIDLGLVEDEEQFEADLLVLRNQSDVNRLDFKLPPNLINQLRVQAAQFAFRG